MWILWNKVQSLCSTTLNFRIPSNRDRELNKQLKSFLLRNSCLLTVDMKHLKAVHLKVQKAYQYLFYKSFFLFIIKSNNIKI